MKNHTNTQIRSEHHSHGRNIGIRQALIVFLAALVSALSLVAVVVEARAAIAVSTPIPFPTYGAVPPSEATVTGGATNGAISVPNTPQPSAPLSTVQPPAIPVTATPLPLPSPAPRTALRPQFMGVQIHPNLREEQWRAMMDFAQFMGMKWIKVQLSWKELEPEPGVYSQLDGLLPRFFQYSQGRNGFKLLVSFAKAPAWARSPGAQGDGPPADPQKLAAFVSRAISQYGIRDEDALEIWNEPNTVADWTGVPLNAATYMKYFDASYKAIRTKLPSATVITGGLSPTVDGAGSVDDRRWLQEMYDLGLKNYAGIAVGIHPYGWANPPDARCCEKSDKGWRDNIHFFFLETIDGYRQIMVKNGHAEVKLWATEFGWATFDNLRVGDHVSGPNARPPERADLGWMRQLTEAQRTEYTIRAFEIAQNGQYAAFMGPMMLWNLNFADLPGFVSAEQETRPEAAFSVLNGDGFPRSIYTALEGVPKQ